MEKNLPDAVQYGLQMYSERDRIMTEAETRAMNRVSSAEMRVNAALEKAREDAEQRVLDAENEARAILEDAQERADHMIDESEIMRQAREEARIIKNDARVEASEMRLKAQHDAYQLLSSVEDQLSEACKSIRRRRTDLGDEGRFFVLARKDPAGLLAASQGGLTQPKRKRHPQNRWVNLRGV